MCPWPISYALMSIVSVSHSDTVSRARAAQGFPSRVAGNPLLENDGTRMGVLRFTPMGCCRMRLRASSLLDIQRRPVEATQARATRWLNATFARVRVAEWGIDFAAKRDNGRLVLI